LVEEGGAESFVVKNIPLGQNTIKATSEANFEGLHYIYALTPGSVSNYSGLTNDEANGWMIAQLEDLSMLDYGHNNTLPIYAEYKGEAEANLVSGSQANVNIDMATENGSMLVTFGPENAYDLENYKVKVGVVTDNHDPMGTWLTADKNMASLYWTGEHAVEGAKVVITLSWFEKDASPYSEALKVSTFDVNIDGGVSKWTKVLLGREAFVKSETGLKFEFTPIEDKDDVVYVGEEVIKMSDIVEADWNLSTGAFVAQDGYKWTRADANGASNLAAAVYYSADWNQNLKDQASLTVVSSQEEVNGWDLLVYNNYTDTDLFDAWEAKYCDASGVFKAEKLRSTWYYYDALGAVIGMHRAFEAGVMDQAKYDASIVVATARIADLGGLNKEYQNAFFKLIADETGETLGVTPATTVNTAGFDAQNLGFAA
ncbi:MAG: hypothetical protein KAH32_08535, partial [Chlamydiia bacterium]|nr:hypothetical protein [Chlamydiia bacterium]